MRRMPSAMCEVQFSLLTCKDIWRFCGEGGVVNMLHCLC